MEIQAKSSPGARRGRISFDLARRRAILRAQERLTTFSWPRVQMGLIVALTGATGLLVSYLLLSAGLDSMAMRYPLAVLGAYAAFLALVWLWLRTFSQDYSDLPLGDLPTPEMPVPGQVFSSGGGGDFGGGGASASFDDVGLPDSSEPLDAAGEVITGAAQAEELAIPLIVVILAIGLAIASFYVIYIAPLLFAEVLVDGAISYALYRHLRGEDSHHWLMTAIRRSILPFLATAVFVSIVGAFMSVYAPGARSIGEVTRHVGAK